MDRFSYKGLSPYQFMPMLGVHKEVLQNSFREIKSSFSYSGGKCVTKSGSMYLDDDDQGTSEKLTFIKAVVTEQGHGKITEQLPGNPITKDIATGVPVIYGPGNQPGVWKDAVFSSWKGRALVQLKVHGRDSLITISPKRVRTICD